MAVVNPRHDDNDLALTGIPRGGTTLACRLLGQATGCVALFEPIDPAASISQWSSPSRKMK